MPPSTPHHLSRRERQIMDVIYALGRATAADVHERLADPPSYSAVRALLRVLEEKGHLTHAQDIVSELASTLDVTAWDGAKQLLSVYTFLLTELVGANVAPLFRKNKQVRAEMDLTRRGNEVNLPTGIQILGAYL